MRALLACFFLVFLSEMGDRTQFLALLLSARTRRPWAVLAGLACAAGLSLGLAALLGSLLSAWVRPETLKWVLGLGFLGFGLWMLVPERDAGQAPAGFAGAFLTTATAVFIAEFGDKAQIAVVALAAHYRDAAWVSVGGALGMVAADILPVAFGERILAWLPLKGLRWGASLLFFSFGVWVLLRG